MDLGPYNKTTCMDLGQGGCGNLHGLEIINKSHDTPLSRLDIHTYSSLTHHDTPLSRLDIHTYS